MAMKSSYTTRWDTISIAAICRDIGINRQQFNRYLAAQTRPSPYNAGKIARYFGLKP